MPSFLSDGVRLHFTLAGPDDGIPTLFLHGYASHYQLNWVGSRWQETVLNAGRLAVGLDQRGHGQSGKPHDPPAYAHRVMAADAVRLLDHLGIREADMVGYSMGSRIGLRAAIDHPGRLNRLVLGGLGALGGFTRAEEIARRMRGDESVTDPVAESFYQFAVRQPLNDLEALAACILGDSSQFTGPELASVRKPVLVVVGELDHLVSGGRELSENLPLGRYLELPGRDHMNAVPAKQFKEAALGFLEEPVSAAGGP